MKRVGIASNQPPPAVRSDAEGGFFNFAVRKSITNWSKFTSTARFRGAF